MKKLLPMAAIMLGVAAAFISFTPEVEAQDYHRLELYEMPSDITTCTECNHLRSGSGPLYDCLECENGCNCLVGAYTDPATGYPYDGQYYPGVP